MQTEPEKKTFLFKIGLISFIVWIVSICLFLGFSALFYPSAKANGGIYTFNQNITFIVTAGLSVLAFVIFIFTVLLKILRSTKHASVAGIKSFLKSLGVVTLVFYGLFTIFMTGKLAVQITEIRNERYASLKTLGSADMVALVNKERSDNGVSPLRENPLLDASAKAKACDMVAKGYFDHNDPTGRAPWHFFIDAGYVNYKFAGENLVAGYFGDQESMRRLMNSPEHKENILDTDFMEIGIGKCGEYTVQHFSAK